MNPLTLYSYRRCPFAMRARMTLEEKQIPYTLIEENLSSLSAELLTLHPEGRVPLLVHTIGGHRQVIYQSTIITEYLEETFPDRPLMPKDPIARAQVRLWTYWCDYIFKPDLDLYKYELSKLPAEEAAALQTRLHEHFAKWNDALNSTGFLVGATFTLADLHLFPFARQFMRIKPPLAKMETYTKLQDWLTRMLARPAFERVMAKP